MMYIFDFSNTCCSKSGYDKRRTSSQVASLYRSADQLASALKESHLAVDCDISASISSRAPASWAAAAATAAAHTHVKRNLISPLPSVSPPAPC